MVFDLDAHTAALKDLLRLDGFLANHVRHGNFASLYGEPHSGERAEKCNRGQNERYQRHSKNPLQTVSQRHYFDSPFVKRITPGARLRSLFAAGVF
jgi:hypothetical protein